MKRLLLILLLVPLIALFGCDSNYTLHDSYIKQKADTTPETVIVTETVTVEKIVEVENTKKIEQLEGEVQAYKDLIGNLNELLSCVYYGYASNDNWVLDGFTAFSIEYNKKYYLITAGHCVEPEGYGKMNSFKFKANFSNEWIYPKLLKYENEFYKNRDYAIFYSDKINNGLDYDLINTDKKYVLGYQEKNLIKKFLERYLEEGESGAPVIDIDGEVIGVATGLFTDIDLIIQALDSF